MDVAGLDEVAASFEHAHPLDILRWAGRHFGDELLVTASFGDAVLVHLVSQAIPDAEVVLLDTGYLFAETQWYAERLRTELRTQPDASSTRSPTPSQTSGSTTPTAAARRARSNRYSGPWPAVAPGSPACGAPTPPLGRMPRSSTSTRSVASPRSTRWRRGATTDVAHYSRIELLPEHPLASRGYASIGCWPCTRPVTDGEDARAGRWAGSTKTECGLPRRPGNAMTVEDVKRGSDHLRGELAAELASDTESFAGEGSEVLLKFHGIYQQDDRDVRRERASKKLPLSYSCMVRAAVPGGELTAEQWLALDRLAELTDGTMRLTTRQGVQFHFVHKGSLRKLVNGINTAGMTTLAACGDVVRNIMACPWPDERQAVLRPLVDELVRRFRPRTAAYWELWVDGDKAVTAEPAFAIGGGDAAEPVYGIGLPAAQVQDRCRLAGRQLRRRAGQRHRHRADAQR